MVGAVGVALVRVGVGSEEIRSTETAGVHGTAHWCLMLLRGHEDGVGAVPSPQGGAACSPASLTPTLTQSTFDLCAPAPPTRNTRH